jgi:hypothetical protein
MSPFEKAGAMLEKRRAFTGSEFTVSAVVAYGYYGEVGSGLPYVLLVQRYVKLTLDFGTRPFCIPKKTQQTPRSHESAVQTFGEP